MSRRAAGLLASAYKAFTLRTYDCVSRYSTMEAKPKACYKCAVEGHLVRVLSFHYHSSQIPPCTPPRPTLSLVSTPPRIPHSNPPLFTQTPPLSARPSALVPIKVTKVRELKRSNEVTKMAWTPSESTAQSAHELNAVNPSYIHDFDALASIRRPCFDAVVATRVRTHTIRRFRRSLDDNHARSMILARRVVPW
ncbi:hypothetical protein B0H10DRAFT_2237031 [Mycena sp. CBHHK59/15]|nr:hypothetical protein B0H10DRAFT_2237031 [Mycena sp. CBHHK59/15]